jgi:hypothetical protein
VVRASAALLLVLVGSLAGCHVPLLLAHDKILGPTSPAGEVRGAATGDEFKVTAQGVVATPSDQLFRPYPRTLFRRLWQPKSFYGAVQGIEAFVAAVSPFVLKTAKYGDPSTPRPSKRSRSA